MTTITAPDKGDLVSEPHAAPFVQTLFGRLVIVGVFTALLAGLDVDYWWAIGGCLALMSLLPQHRKWILTVAAAAWVILDKPIDWGALNAAAPRHAAGAYLRYWPIGVAVVWTIAFGYLWIIQRFPKSLVAQRPVMGLLAILAILIAASQSPITGPAWVIIAAATMAFSSYLWFFAYWVSENATRAKSNAIQRTCFWRPIWNGTNVPFGKGAAYMERVEAKTDEQLATAQLKGLKLLLWAVVLTLVVILANQLIYRIPAGAPLTNVPAWPKWSADALIPPYPMALDAMTAGQPYSLPMRWASLVMHFLMHMATLTIFGAEIIAIVRMAGFNAFRNTYRPFEATSIAEFYNRIYYYFKELLVVFFFYPTYLRYLKKWPKARLFVATLMAAGVGNWLYHFLRDQGSIFRFGFGGALSLCGAYAVYALILGVAISVSQLRTLAHKGRHPTGYRKVLAMAGVIFFYTLISVFEEPNDRHGLRDYTAYLVSLFHL